MQVKVARSDMQLEGGVAGAGEQFFIDCQRLHVKCGSLQSYATDQACLGVLLGVKQGIGQG